MEFSLSAHYRTGGTHTIPSPKPANYLVAAQVRAVFRHVNFTQVHAIDTDLEARASGVSSAIDSSEVRWRSASRL